MHEKGLNHSAKVLRTSNVEAKEAYADNEDNHSEIVLNVDELAIKKEDTY